MTIDRIIKHPDYDASSNHDYDVALLKLKNPIQYNSHVRPVCLAKTDFDAGTNCYVTGWGHTSEGGDIPQVKDKHYTSYYTKTLSYFLYFCHFVCVCVCGKGRFLSMCRIILTLHNKMACGHKFVAAST